MRLPTLASLVAVFALAAFASGCAHRPRYKDLVAASGVNGAQEGTSVPVALVDPATGAPLSGVKVQFGDRKRVSLTTNEKGRIEVPVSKDFDKENPLVEVNRSTGGGYKLQQVIAPPAAATPEATEAPATPAPSTP